MCVAHAVLFSLTHRFPPPAVPPKHGLQCGQTRGHCTLFPSKAMEIFLRLEGAAVCNRGHGWNAVPTVTGDGLDPPVVATRQPGATDMECLRHAKSPFPCISLFVAVVGFDAGIKGIERLVAGVFVLKAGAGIRFAAAVVHFDVDDALVVGFGFDGALVIFGRFVFV